MIVYISSCVEEKNTQKERLHTGAKDKKKTSVFFEKKKNEIEKDVFSAYKQPRCIFFYSKNIKNDQKPNLTKKKSISTQDAFFSRFAKQPGCIFFPVIYYTHTHIHT